MESGTAVSKGAATSRALQESTVCGAFQVTAVDAADRVALRTKGDEFSVTWGEYAERVRRMAAGLAALGLERGDTIALMMTNRPEFYFADSAAMHLGATPFSIYNTYSAEQIEYLVSDAKNRIIVTEPAFLDAILKVKESCSEVEHVIVADEAPDGTLSFEDVEGRGEEDFDFDAAWQAVEADDILTLIYTSGTTGPPKGVQVTHDNVLSAARSYTELIDFPSDGARAVSYLPMAHIAERMAGYYLPVLHGFTVTCCPDPREVVGYLPEVRPNWFFAVPRIWEKLMAGLQASFQAQEDENKRKATEWALDVGLRKVRAEQAGEEVPQELLEEHAKADELVLSKIRERLGFDDILSVNVGAAPTPREVLEFFHALGIPVGELWGLSETCGAGCCNPPERVKLGTVGPPAPGMELKLGEDGEVLLRGPMIMPGYRNAPDKTKEAIDDDGWFHTGDIGELDEDNYLKIVDRKKELIINAAGKNMSPANIEAKVKSSSPLIGQAIAIGDGRPYNVALITLDPDAAPGFAKKQSLSDSSLEALAKEDAVLKEIQKGIDRANEQLARVEGIKKFKVLETDWEPGGDELTPTMKLKRKPIAEKYKEEIEALYAE